MPLPGQNRFQITGPLVPSRDGFAPVLLGSWGVPRSLLWRSLHAGTMLRHKSLFLKDLARTTRKTCPKIIP